MIFTQIDKQVATILSTLVKYVDDKKDHMESIIAVGQHLGVPKEETIELIEEWEEEDSLTFRSDIEKSQFIKEAFHEVLVYDDESINKLYIHVSKELGISA